jgi:Carboxypeptidase regulatory-like domain
MRWRTMTSRWLGLLMLMLLCTSGVFAQEVTGSIAGTVTDNSGAVVSNATVKITNTDTTVVIRTLKTDSSGTYSAPLLPLGNYSVEIAAAGFKGIVRSGIVLNVGSKLTQNFALEVGSSGETVNVQADATQVELQSAAASGLITGTQVRELALNGRNWAQLMTLQPGVSDAGNFDQLYVGAFAPQGTNLITFSLNGGRREENNYMVDGADNVDRGSNLTLLAFPSIDAISEFKIVRGQYDPELGRSASGQVNVITKSGTADLHGNLYEFFRNDALNANNYFNKQAEIAGNKPNKPPYLRYHDFGGTIGGPVWIPKIYEQRNKTFFFFSEEARRNITYSNGNVDIPTAAMLQGNFLHPVCANGTCGTSINPASFDPLAAAYIKDVFSKYPQPNNTATDPFNYISVLKGIFNYREEIYKIDHNFGPKLQVNAKMLRDSIPTREPGGLFTNLGIDNIGNTDTNSPAHNYTFHGTIVPTSNLLIDVGYFYSYGAILSKPNNLLSAANSPDVAGAATLPFKTTLGRIPSITLLGGVGPATFGPYNDFDQNHQIFGNVSKIWGTHSIKVGATYYHYRKNENAGNGNQANYAFTATGTPGGATTSFEQAWANFLTGHVQTFTQSSLDLTADIRDNSLEYYAQDAWRVRPNFTITYGVRHSIFREPYDAKGLLENFDPRFYDPAKAPCITASGATDVSKSPTGVLTSACNPNFNPLNGYIFANPPAGGTKSPYGNKVSAENIMTFAPRFGFAWDPWNNGKTSVRGGFGLFFDSGMTFGNAENDVFTGIGFQNPLNFTNVTFANPTGGAPIPATGIPGAATALTSRIDPSGVHPYTQQWSLDIQRDLHDGWLLDVGYYGNSSIHLPGFLDLNQPAKNAYLDCTAASPCYAGPNVPHTAAYAVNFLNYMQGPSSLCTLTINVGTVAKPVLKNNECPGNFISNGANGGFSNFNNLNALRPYIGYLGMQAVRNIYTANYNSLQTQLQKKFKNGTMVDFAYTWSHGLTTNQADRTTGAIMPIQGDFRGVYGPTVGDRRQVFTANFVWNLPWLQTQKGVVGHVLGGWELSGIQTAQTGLPATVSALQNFDPTGADCLGSSPCSFRVNQVGDPDTNPGRTFSNWINPNAYTQPAPVLTNVNGVQTWVAQSYWPTERPGSARLPGFWRTDVSLFKNLKFTERFGGQFRLEAFNVFNHTNPVCCSSFATSSGNFNKVVSTRDPRYLELALKLNF